jgi:hypothetical protein
LNVNHREGVWKSVGPLRVRRLTEKGLRLKLRIWGREVECGPK